MRNWAGYVRHAREHARLSRSGLAKAIGTSYATVWRWETGKQTPERATIVVRLAEATGVDVDEALAAAGLRPGHDAPAAPRDQRPPLDPDLALLARRLHDPATPRAEREIIRAALRHLARLSEGEGEQRRAG